MPAGPIQKLTAEESLELVLTLAGRLQAAMGAPPEERENAQARTMDMLVSLNRYLTSLILSCIRFGIGLLLRSQ